MAGATDLPKLNVPEQGAAYTFVAPPFGHVAYAPVVAAPALESPDGLMAGGARLVFVGDGGGLFHVRAGGRGRAPLDPTAGVSLPDWQP